LSPSIAPEIAGKVPLSGANAVYKCVPVWGAGCGWRLRSFSAALAAALFGSGVGVGLVRAVGASAAGGVLGTSAQPTMKNEAQMARAASAIKREIFRRPLELPMASVVSLGCFLRFVILIRRERSVFYGRFCTGWSESP
jgi:hypothetical protein